MRRCFYISALYPAPRSKARILQDSEECRPDSIMHRSLLLSALLVRKHKNHYCPLFCDLSHGFTGKNVLFFRVSKSAYSSVYRSIHARTLSLGANFRFPICNVGKSARFKSWYAPDHEILSSIAICSAFSTSEQSSYAIRFIFILPLS